MDEASIGNGRRSAEAADAGFFSSLREETRFYIVRHGQSEGNARMIIQGRREFGLDEAGRSQAASAGAWLAAKRIDAIIASPLARAAETARIVAAACALPGLRLEPLLAEIDTGMFSGLSLDEARTRFPEVYAAFERRSWDGVPDAESSAAIYGRAMEAWGILRRLASEGSRNLVCITHGGFIQWLVRTTFGCRSWMPLLTTGNCGVFELLVMPTGTGEPAYLQWRLLNFQAAAAVATLPPVF